MQTTIKKKITPNQMEKAFNLINIRYFEPLGKLIDFDIPIMYEITIRHDEGVSC